MSVDDNKLSTPDFSDDNNYKELLAQVEKTNRIGVFSHWLIVILFLITWTFNGVVSWLFGAYSFNVIFAIHCLIISAVLYYCGKQIQIGREVSKIVEKGDVPDRIASHAKDVKEELYMFLFLTPVSLLAHGIYMSEGLSQLVLLLTVFLIGDISLAIVTHLLK